MYEQLKALFVVKTFFNFHKIKCPTVYKLARLPLKVD